MAANEQLAMLVQPDRVHRSVYADPAIFELELERIFGRAWLVLGHESQVRNAGDYFTTRMGREPAIVARHDDGSLRALINRCAHHRWPWRATRASPASRARSTTTTSRCARCARTARPTRFGKAPASGPRRAVMASWATTTTTIGSWRVWATRPSINIETS